MPSKIQRDLARVRRGRAYSAAIWCGRLVWVSGVAFGFMMFRGTLDGLTLLPALAMAVSWASSYVLLHRAGIRIEWVGRRRFVQIANPTIRRQYGRDVFWLRHR